MQPCLISPSLYMNHSPKIQLVASDIFLLKELCISKVRVILLFKNENLFYKCNKKKQTKNDNISFSKNMINIDDLYKTKKELFWKVHKIPYGCIYDKISI